MLFLAGRDDVANVLYELCYAAGLGVMVVQPPPTREFSYLPPASIRAR